MVLSRQNIAENLSSQHDGNYVHRCDTIGQWCATMPNYSLYRANIL